METTPIPAAEAPAPHIEIRDNGMRRTFLYWFFGGWILVTLVAIPIRFWQLHLMQEIQDTGYYDEAINTLADLMDALVGLAQLGLFIGTVVIFLLWFRRAYANLHRMGIGYLKHKESWSIWSWIVPIVSLWYPAGIMGEIWTETGEQNRKLNTGVAPAEGKFMIGIWWTLFIIGNIIGRFILRTLFKDETLEDLIYSTQLTLWSDGLQVLEGAALVYVVWAIGKMEAGMARGVVEHGGTVVKG